MPKDYQIIAYICIVFINKLSFIMIPCRLAMSIIYFLFFLLRPQIYQKLFVFIYIMPIIAIHVSGHVTYSHVQLEIMAWIRSTLASSPLAPRLPCLPRRPFFPRGPMVPLIPGFELGALLATLRGGANWMVLNR